MLVSASYKANSAAFPPPPIPKATNPAPFYWITCPPRPLPFALAPSLSCILPSSWRICNHNRPGWARVPVDAERSPEEIRCCCCCGQNDKAFFEVCLTTSIHTRTRIHLSDAPRGFLRVTLPALCKAHRPGLVWGMLRRERSERRKNDATPGAAERRTRDPT
jgi:hypothetical protein